MRANALKLEGGVEMAPSPARPSGIPVMAHIGFTHQSDTTSAATGSGPRRRR